VLAVFLLLAPYEMWDGYPMFLPNPALLAASANRAG
jgi:hypothetical protein